MEKGRWSWSWRRGGRGCLRASKLLSHRWMLRGSYCSSHCHVCCDVELAADNARSDPELPVAIKHLVQFSDQY